MSRRQSRVSIDSRQNDTLLEFENFKKKFLLANKHITKLNSTLSVRIEELNAQISSLYVENLRLRASEIALSAQLKKEREKTRKIIADAEAATTNFMKHLGFIRKSHNIPQQSPPREEKHAPLPRARRPTLNPDATPPPNRIARAPTIPGIAEDDEDNLSNVEEDDEGLPSPTPIRRKSKPRSSSTSSSRLPLRVASPPEEDSPSTFDEELTKSGKRRPTRRQSGLLTTSMSITTVTERPPSPAFGSPLRREAGLAEEEEEVLAVIGGLDGEEDEEPEIITQSITRREKRKKKVKESEGERERESSGDSNPKEKERKRPRDVEDHVGSMDAGKKSKLKDVTNSPPNRSPLPPLDTTSERDRQHTPDQDIPSSATSTTTSHSLATTRTFLTTPATTPAPSLKDAPYPTPRSSSPPLVSATSDSEPTATGRERRVRKSVNYAEPKLNTKMRKPDPPSGTSSSKRASTSSRDSTSRASIDPPPITSSSSNDTVAPQPVAGVKRKKSRIHTPVEEDEESEGAQADAEFGGLRGSGSSSSSSWVNTDGRRRSVHTSSHSRRLEGDDGRRHSMAV
ncbi:hypothetical protein K474DRAFT_1665142 [Panus rudis PR-1116 ss-1]|nr:hypothetical protein K474DRAFT_1665142 [Panus rudis PR-1116 ss-1]